MIVAALIVLFVPVADLCQFPSQLVGVWDSTVTRWSDLTISTTIISKLPAQLIDLDFTCYLKNGTTYIIQSETQTVATVTYHYYTCLDIIPSDSNSDVVFFRILTEPNPSHENDTVVSLLSTQDKVTADICQKNSTEFPLHFNMFLKRGFEDNSDSYSCPRSLQAEFAVNFTDTLQQSQCPDGFVLSGCDRSRLSFNYTLCGNDTSLGDTNYTCLNTVEKGNVTYSTIYTTPAQQGGQANAFEFACLEMTTVDGQMSITKSGGTCGATPSVEMMANETLSCRAPDTTTTVTPAVTTEAGRNDTTQAPPSGSEGPGTGNGGQGGGGNGEVDDGSGDAAIAIPGVATLLVPVLASLLAIARP